MGELHGCSQISANIWLAPHQHSHIREKKKKAKTCKHLTTSFYQQGKAVFIAMDLSVQALRAEAKRVNIRNHCHFECICLSVAVPDILGLCSTRNKCSVLETWQAPISAGRKHATVVSPDQDIGLELHSCSALSCSFLGRDRVPVHHKNSFAYGGKGSWGNRRFF